MAEWMTKSSAGGQEPPIKIGVSTCLLGQKVRFDAGHKHDRPVAHLSFAEVVSRVRSMVFLPESLLLRC